MTNGNLEPWRVVIDTNIWISFLIGKRLSGLHRHICDKQITVIISNIQLRELADVLNRPRIRKYISKELAEEFLELLCEMAVFVEPQRGASLCRNPKDDYLLYTALAAKADYLVSGDNDLLSLQTMGSTRILSFVDFEYLMARRTS